MRSLWPPSQGSVPSVTSWFKNQWEQVVGMTQADPQAFEQLGALKYNLRLSP